MNDPNTDIMLRYTVLSLFVGMILIGLLFYAILK